MGIWREPMFARAATTKSVVEQVERILELCGLRCSKCGRWCDSTVTVSRTVEWGGSTRGPLLMDPIFIKAKVRICRCGHIIFSRITLNESA